MASNKDKIYGVVSRVFGVPQQSLTDDSSPDSIAGWDSASHINLVVSLEAEFGISLNPEDTMEMLSVGLIRTILAEHGIRDADGAQ